MLTQLIKKWLVVVCVISTTLLSAANLAADQEAFYTPKGCCGKLKSQMLAQALSMAPCMLVIKTWLSWRHR